MTGCFRVVELRQGRAAGLSAADSLRLEEHVSHCSACLGELRALDALRDELHVRVEPLSSQQRQVLIESALVAASHGAVPRRAGRRPVALFGLAAAATAAATLLSVGPWSVARPVVHPRDVAAHQPVARAVATAPSDQPGEPRGATAMHNEGTIDTHEAARALRVGPAQLQLAARSTLRVHHDRPLVTLDAGRMEVVVGESRDAPFEMRTRHYGVTVLAAQFVAEPESIQVIAGQVRVVSPEGTTLVEQLGAGSRWTRDEGVTVAAAGSTKLSASERTASVHDRAPTPVAHTAQLDRARALLAERRVGEARTAIEAVLRSGAKAASRAEALSLTAECALVEKHYEQAVVAYLQVAAQYPRLGAGQNALFAAARVRVQQGQSAQARALLHRYLSRYPSGRFQAEARARLSQLEGALIP